jgi:NTE family protein
VTDEYSLSTPEHGSESGGDGESAAGTAGEQTSNGESAAGGRRGDDRGPPVALGAGDGDGDAAAGDRTRVAIACQGGGSHTAFTAGVLRGLFEDWDPAYELVGISGTSGGAFNALAAWYGLVTGDAERARSVLGELWRDLAATELPDRLSNDFGLFLTRLQDAGLPTARVSPYDNPAARYGQRRIGEILDRHVDFEAIPDLCSATHPELVVGTVDVNGGVFETFTNEAVTTEAILASAAVPELFPGVEIDGHLHWDGLFSQNPPINDLMAVPADRKPEELWIVQINPQTEARNPRTLEEIADRRNELSGNISLNQELRFVEWVNDWIDAGHLPADQFSRTTVRRIEMRERYHFSTKTDRSPAFVQSLIDLGEKQAAEFLAALRDETAAGAETPAGTGHDGDHAGVTADGEPAAASGVPDDPGEEG